MTTTEVPVSPEATAETIGQIVKSLNDVWYKVSDVSNDVRQLEFRVDQFTPKTVNMTVTNHTPLLVAGVAVFAFWAGAVGYREYLRNRTERKQSEQPLQTSTT